MAVERSKFGTFAILAGANLFCLAAGVIVLELAFGEWFTPYYPPSGAIFDRTFQFRQELYEPHGVVTYVRDRYGLRGADGRLERIELVTVGGSTTDQRYISEGETWQDVEEARSGMQIANAGDDGMSSTGHIVALTEWLHRVPGLRPRIYLHYIGVNDALLARSEGDTAREMARLVREDEKAKHTLSRTIKGRSALYQAGVRIVAWMQGPPTIFALGNPGTSGAEVRVQADERQIAGYIEEVYRPNLARIMVLHRARGEQVVMVSQPMRPGLVRRAGNDTFARDGTVGGFAIALGMINQATETFCRAHAPDCRFIDLAGRLTFADSDFYDLVHTTPSGARRIGTFLADELTAILGRTKAQM
jgi:hypothetical protein